MLQVLFRVPFLGVPIFGYGVMLFFAFLGAMNLAAWRARREGLDRELIYDLALWLFLGGLVGARSFYVVQKWGTYVHSFWDIFKIWEGGIVLYGSIMGGALAFFVYKWLRPFPFRPYADCIAPSLCLGVALGRIGCFLNGCCFGDRCDIPGLGVSFPAHSAPWEQQRALGLITSEAARSLPVHATQLYSAIDGFILLALLTAYYPLRRRDGEVLGVLMMTYPISRFLIEHLRNDEGVFFAGMTVSQNISVLIFAGGLLYWAWLVRKPLGRHADTIGKNTPTEELAQPAMA